MAPMGKFRSAFRLLTLFLLFVAPAGAAPGCFGPLVAGGKVVKLDREGHMQLADGRVIVLTGIRDIHGWTPPPGMRVYLYAFSPKQDRYGRLRAMVHDASGRWWQQDLLKNGRAIVDIATDRYECAAQMYAAEDEARVGRRGLWRHMRIYPTERAPGDFRFHIIRGKVLRTLKKNGRVYLNFGSNWRTDFTVTISPEDMKRFRHLRSDPLALEGQMIEVRGMVQSYHGPEIEIANPFQMRTLP